MIIRTTYMYRCDGGINPKHHHPKSEAIYEQDNVFKVGLNGPRFDNLKDAESVILNKYDFVEHEWTSVSTTLIHDKIIKS